MLNWKSLNGCILVRLKIDRDINIINQWNYQDKTVEKWVFKELDVVKL